MSELVTGEAVPLELRLAKLPSRALGFAIDFAILIVAFLALAFALTPLVSRLDSAAAAAVGLGVNVVVLVGIQTTVETLTRGKSVGKLALGLRVVRDDGGSIRFRHALTRWLTGAVVDFSLAGSVAIITSLLNERGKRVGDILAGTVVVRERVPATVAALPPIPRPLAQWAANADIGNIPDGLSVAARNYLARARELDPRIRDTMGAQLANDMSAYVSPAAPPGMPPWTYLAAVLSERHRRLTEHLAAPRRTGEPSHLPTAASEPASATPPAPVASANAADKNQDPAADSSETGFAPPA